MNMYVKYRFDLINIKHVLKMSPFIIWADLNAQHGNSQQNVFVTGKYLIFVYFIYSCIHIFEATGGILCRMLSRVSCYFSQRWWGWTNRSLRWCSVVSQTQIDNLLKRLSILLYKLPDKTNILSFEWVFWAPRRKTGVTQRNVCISRLFPDRRVLRVAHKLSSCVYF